MKMTRIISSVRTTKINKRRVTILKANLVFLYNFRKPKKCKEMKVESIIFNLY